jgi:Flp pilus assembly pilin Flp
MRTAKNEREKGYTLLEYCAGAVIVVTLVFSGLQTLGGDLKTFLINIGAWAKNTQITPQQ